MDNHSPHLIAFGQALRRQRELLKLSQEELAHISNVHRTYLGGVERGERNPTLRTLLKLAEALQLPLSDLVRVMECLEEERLFEG